MKRLARILAFVAALAALSPIAANAVATITTAPLSSTAWTDLGVGPMRLFAGGQNTRYAISDSAPSLTIQGFAVGDYSTDVSTTSHVWVISTNPQFPAYATYAPITAGGGGGGGGGAVTVADGADTAEGTTSDLSTASTLIGLNKAIKASEALGATAANQTAGNGTLTSIFAGQSTAANQTNGNHKTQIVDSAGTNQFTAGNPGFVSGGASQATNSAPINIAAATTTQLVALSAGKVIQVTGWDVLAAGTGNITFEYGTGGNCASGTTPITGPYNLVAQAGMSRGNGLGPILFIPASNALCAVTSAAVQMSGSVSYLQF